MVSKMANLLIRESSDLDDSTSHDDELEQMNIADNHLLGRSIVNSSKKVDRRIVDLYRLKRFKEDRKHHKQAISII